MKRFWSIAASRWPLSIPVRRLESILGAPLTAAIAASGLVEVAALNEGDSVECAECGRLARLVSEPEGLVALCPEECPAERFGLAPARLVVAPQAFARRLAAAFDLSGVPGAEAPLIQLGRRSIGDDLVAFDLVAHPRRPEVIERLRWVVRGGPPVRVLLAPDSRGIPADAPAEMGAVELLWLGLDEVVRLEGSLRVDLDALTSRRTFRGYRPVPTPFGGLVLDAHDATWAGVRVGLEGAPLLRRLLGELAARPNQLVTREDLWRSLYPDDFTRRGNLARGVNPEDLNDRLRRLVGKLRGALQRAAPDGHGPLVENARGSESVGGYFLALRPEMVRVT